MCSLKRTVAVVLLGLAATPGNAADAIGRLFMTPEQRADLDSRRDFDSAQIPASVQKAQPRAASLDQQVILNGVVRRSRGPDVVWVNGARATASADQPVQLRGGPDRRNRVILEEAGGTRARLKPGQVWVPASGRVVDCFGCAAPSTPADVLSAPPAAAAKAPGAPPDVQP